MRHRMTVAVVVTNPRIPSVSISTRVAWYDLARPSHLDRFRPRHGSSRNCQRPVSAHSFMLILSHDRTVLDKLAEFAARWISGCAVRNDCLIWVQSASLQTGDFPNSWPLNAIRTVLSRACSM